METVPEEVTMRLRANGIALHQRSGAAVSRVAQTKVLRRSQDILEQRIRIEQTNQRILPNDLQQSLVIEAAEQRRKLRDQRALSDAEEPDIWRLCQIGNVGDQESWCAEGSQLRKIRSHSLNGIAEDDRARLAAGVASELRRGKQHSQSVTNVVGTNPDHKQVCWLRRLAGKVGQVFIHLGAEIKVREYRRMGSGAGTANRIVGEDARNAQRRIAARRNLQRRGKLLSPGSAITEMMSSNVIRGYRWIERERLPRTGTCSNEVIAGI